MKKRRILAVTLALVALMMCGLTSLAKQQASGDIIGNIDRSGANSVWASTRTVSTTNLRVYVKLTEEYMSSIGNIYVSSPVINTSNSGKIEATYTPNGSFMSAWSGHGHTGTLFEIYI